MKTSIKLICSSLLAIFAATSCVKEAVQITFSSDPETLSGIPCKDPSPVVLNLQTNANWIVITPDWVKADPVFGSGNTAVTITVKSTFVNANTDVAPRSGELVFSGGGKSYTVLVSQEGYEAPYDPSSSIGGITDMDEFEKFVAAVNKQEGLTRWQNANQEIELLTDLNLNDYEKWTPIGNPETVNNGNYLGSYTGPSFKGVFNGGGHTIKNFKPTAEVADKGTWGFFGVLDGATVKDLTIETDLTISAEATADAGVLAGTVISSTIQNVKVTGKITSLGTATDNKRFALGGIVGLLFNTGDGISTMKDCSVNLNVTASNGSNLKNSATSAMFGGMAGFITTAQDNSANDIQGCVAKGEINCCLGRCGGICATANYGGHFKDCKNYMNQYNTIADGRIGNMISVLYKNASVEDCENHGNLTTTNAKTHAGAIIGFFNDAAIVFNGGKNTGTVIAANETYRGLIGANISNFASISNIAVGGKLGVYKEGADPEMIDVNAGNFQQYIGSVSDANREKITNLTWDGSAPVVTEGIGTAEQLKEFASLVNAGGDYSKFAVDGEVVLSADIDLEGAEWAPIGTGTTSGSAVIGEGAVPFTGKFNGKGHKIDNFKITVPANAPAGSLNGLFGLIQGATIKNVKIGSKAVISSTASEDASYAGLLVGGMFSSDVDNCQSEGSITFAGGINDKRSVIAGLIGTAQVSDVNMIISNCTSNCKTISADNKANTKNGGSGVIVGGVVGFTDALGSNTDFYVIVENCTNNSSFTTGGTRVGGIVGTPNKFTKIQGCTNNGNISGNDTKASNSRVAGIAPTTGGSTIIKDCTNKGNITFAVEGNTTQGFAAGICAQVNNAGLLENCYNAGTIRSDIIKGTSKYIGSIFCHCNRSAATIKNCRVEGAVGPYVEDADNKVVTVTASNFENYITMIPKTDATNASAIYEGNYCNVQ